MTSVTADLRDEFIPENSQGTRQLSAAPWFESLKVLEQRMAGLQILRGPTASCSQPTPYLPNTAQKI
jgi:hypothetical protein